MKILRLWINCLAVAVLTMGCTVMSQEVQDQALPQMPLSELINQVDRYKGQTAIFGGYVISVENGRDQTRIVAVQTPLGVGQAPKSKDLSQGRLILTYKGFLDPEVYTKDRQITVGGKILDSSAHDPQAPYPYLKIAVQDIHLWPVPKPVPPDYYWYDDFWYPYPWGWGYPYGHRRYW
jgi:outer membrane lipoprotein